MSNIIYWTMKDGQKIAVDDMDINHLRNTLKMIIRNNTDNIDNTAQQFEFDEFDDDDDESICKPWLWD